jgi:hypothetical protein
MCDCERGTFDRRTLLRSAAGTVAAAGVASLWPTAAAASGSSAGGRSVLHPPRPIAGGTQAPGFQPPFDFIHIFSPSANDRNVEPATITDFNGAVAFAVVLGSATGSDETRYNLSVDIRAFEGDYIAEDGSSRRGTFAMI